MSKYATPESYKFYDKLFNLLDLNQALVNSNFCDKLICEMDEEEYQQFLIMIEYLHVKGIINLDLFFKP